MTKEHILSTIAHYELMQGIAKEIPELKGAAAAWAITLSPIERRTIEQYARVKEQARRWLAEAYEADIQKNREK